MTHLLGENWSRSPQKRAFDLAIVLGTLPLSVPIIVGAMAGIAVIDKCNPLFRQCRVGRDGREFIVNKIRTISPTVAEAPSRGQTLAFGATRFGAILRAHRLDEFPQLLNVLNGEMSIVGVRPLMTQEIAMSKDFLTPMESRAWQAARTTMRPGLCDPFAQTIRNSSFDENHLSDYFRARAASDIDFAHKTSPTYDLALLVQSALSAVIPSYKAAHYTDSTCEA